MGLSYRSIRAAGSALLIAVAVGAGGMTGMASALGADPTMVAVAGTLVDGSGQPLGGIHLTIEEELPPDGGIAAFPVTTAGDGTFAADLYAWGSADTPAAVTVETAADEQLTVESGSCSQTWGVLARDRRELALAEAAPEPLVVTATTTLLGEVCGTTGTPGGGNGSTGGAGGAQITPPPTDADLASSNASRDHLGPALTLGFVLGLALASAFLVVRPGTRRRGG